MIGFFADLSLLVRSYPGEPAPPPAPPAPSPSPQPPSQPPLPFSAVIQPSLCAIVGTALSSTTLATITCTDTAMTILLSDEIPGLTFSYSGNVLTVSGTPSGTAANLRLVVTYLASDGSYSARGSTSHDVTIKDSSVVLTISDCASYSGRVDTPIDLVLCTMSINKNTVIRAVPNFSPIALLYNFAWTAGSTSTGQMTLSGYSAEVWIDVVFGIDYYDGSSLVGSSTHHFTAVNNWETPPPAAAPAPAPSPPSPSCPAAPSPTPAPPPPGNPDSFYYGVSVLMHFDASTGLTTDQKGNTFTSSGATSVTGAVAEAAGFSGGAAKKIEGIAANVDALNAQAVECMVNISDTAWSSLMASGSDQRYCPVLTCLDPNTFALIWTLGFFSSVLQGGTRVVGLGFYIPLWGANSQSPSGLTSLALWDGMLTSNPGRFIHLAAGTLRESGNFSNVVWFGGRAGSAAATGLENTLPSLSAGLIRIGGICPLVKGIPNGGDVTLIPFDGSVDELRITAEPRYGAYISTPPSDIPATLRVIPWTNY